MSDAPRLRVVSPDATPEEVAAVVAALSVVDQDRAAAAAAAAAEGEASPRLSEWRLGNRLQRRRGPFRIP